MKDFEAFPNPTADTTGKVEVPVGEELSLDLSLQVGTNPSYEIVWGDGTNTTERKAGNAPQEFTMSHVYDKDGNFTVTMRVFNADTEIVLDPITVEVQFILQFMSEFSVKLLVSPMKY